MKLICSANIRDQTRRIQKNKRNVHCSKIKFHDQHKQFLHSIISDEKKIQLPSLLSTSDVKDKYVQRKGKRTREKTICRLIFFRRYIPRKKNSRENFIRYGQNRSNVPMKKKSNIPNIQQSAPNESTEFFW